MPKAIAKLLKRLSNRAKPAPQPITEILPISAQQAAGFAMACYD